MLHFSISFVRLSVELGNFLAAIFVVFILVMFICFLYFWVDFGAVLVCGVVIWCAFGIFKVHGCNWMAVVVQFCIVF